MFRWRVGGRPLALAVLLLAATGSPRPMSLHAEQTPARTEIRVLLTPAHEVHRPRLVAAAEEALARYGEWLGPYAFPSLIITDRAWTDTAHVPPAQVNVDPPWWSPPELMELESQVAFGVARQWWHHVERAADRAPIGDGLSWYLQSLVVERLFDARYFATAHSVDGVRYFGGTVPWTFPSLRLSRWTAGLAREEFLRTAGPQAWPRPGRRLPPGVDAATVRGGLAFASLERYVGWPALQGALRTLAHDPVGPIAAEAAAATLSAAMGQDLSWFWRQALDLDVHFDYAVQDVVSEEADASCDGLACHRTRITVVRRGTGVFSGSSRAPVGAYDSGDALDVRVTFEDGQVTTVRWDGRAPARTFEFESPSRATAVDLDPGGALLLDENRLDQTYVLSARTNVPVVKWVSTWMVWLQDVMLAYGSVF